MDESDDLRDAHADAPEADEGRATAQRDLDALWAQATGSEDSSSPEPGTQARRHPFRVGDVLGITLNVLGKNPLLYLALALLATLPGIVLEVFFAGARRGQLSFFFIRQAVDIFLSMIFLGAIAYGVYQDLVGGRAGLWSSIAIGLRRYFSLAGISIAMLFLLAVTLFVTVICVMIFNLFGLLALILVLHVLCTYAVAVPACVAEGINAGSSLERSSSLTQGIRLGVFGLFVVYAIVEFIAEKTTGLVFPDMANGVNMGMLFARPFLTAFQEVMVATMYFQLRADKEGVSVDKLAQVFD